MICISIYKRNKFTMQLVRNEYFRNWIIRNRTFIKINSEQNRK